MKDITVIRYNQISNPTLTSGAAYECDIDITDDLIYGQKGIGLLVQMVLIELLKTPGRDVVDPFSGGGLLNLRGLDPTAQNKSEVEVKVVRAVKAVEQQILARQMGQSYPEDETLKSLSCGDDLFYDTTYSNWIIPVVIEALSGETQLLDVPLVQDA